MPEERKLATVLFADIVGSSALGEARDPEAMRTALDRTFQAMSEVIRVHGGTVEKFIGDAVMAVFGVPIAHEDDAERAVRAAFAMRQGATEFEVRIGINTGEVVADTTREGHFLVTGTPVNAAARLEQAASAGEILVGQLTRQLTASAVTYGPTRSVAAKGIGPLDAHPAVEARSAHPLDQRGVPGLRSPLVGREVETALLRDALDHATAMAEPRLVTIYGPPGAGKSRLVRDFVGTIDPIVLSGRCLPYGEGISYYALQMIVEQDAGITPEDPPQTAVEKLRARVGASVPEDEIDAITARLSIIAGRADAETLRDVGPSALSDELSWALARYVSRRAQDGPVVIVVEDVHWADAKLLDLIEDLVTSASGPLLVLCMARPEFSEIRPHWGSTRPGATRIDLPPLADADVRQMISALLSIEDLPDVARQELVSRTEGNPLYIEEFLRMLIDNGAIQRQNDHWVAVGDLSAMEIPATLTGVISARLDRTPGAVKRLLQYGSVIGRSFSTAGLGAFDGSTPATELLRDAVRRDLILQADGPTRGQGRLFRFKHALIRDVAYGTLTKVQRSRLHDAYGRWLERSAPKSAEVRDAVVFHAEQAFLLALEIGTASADVRDRAVEILSVASGAGLQADLRALVALDERALKVARLAGASAEIQSELELRAARRALVIAPTPEAIARLDEALERGRNVPTSKEMVRGQLQRAAVASRADHIERAESLLAQALADARTLGAADVLVDALGAQVTLATWRGDPTSRRAWADEALALARSAGTRRDVMAALGPLRVLLLQGGDYTALRQVHGEIESLADPASPLDTLGIAFRKGQFAWLVGDHAECVRLHVATRARAEELARPGTYVRSSLELGDSLRQVGEIDRALHVLTEASDRLVMRRSTAPEFDLFELDGYLVRALVAARRVDEARALAMRMAAAPGIPGIRAIGQATLAIVAEAEGDTEGAERGYLASVEVASRAGWGWATAHRRVDAGRFLVSIGRHDRARPLLDAARDFYRDPLMWRRREEVEALLAGCDVPGAAG